MKQVLAIQHVEHEDLGALQPALARHGFEPRYIRPYTGDLVPAELGDAAALIVLGGPMAVYEMDQFPYLRDGIELIRGALARDKSIFGICLGSQLLAAAMGVEVVKGEQKEIGWNRLGLTSHAVSDPVFGNQPGELMAFHWHGDVFRLPQGAVKLAKSALTPVQAFRAGPNSYGCLFHPEVTEAYIKGMTTAFASELNQEQISVDEIDAGTSLHLCEYQKLMARIFDRWIEGI